MEPVSGLLVAAVGVATVLGAGIPGLARERRLLALHRVPQGPAFAVPLGAAFALGLLAPSAAARPGQRRWTRSGARRPTDFL